MTKARPTTTLDLLPSERILISGITVLRNGRIQSIAVRNGQVLVEPFPKTIRDVKFGTIDQPHSTKSEEFALKRQVADLLEYIRSIDSGEILVLEVRGGVPVFMRVAAPDLEHRVAERCDV